MATSNTRFTQNSLGQSKNPIDSDHGIYRYKGATSSRWSAVRRWCGRSRRAPSNLDSAYAASGHVWLIRVFAGRLDNRRPTVDLACESSLRGCRRSPIGGHRLGADLAEALHQIGII